MYHNEYDTERSLLNFADETEEEESESPVGADTEEDEGEKWE